MVEPRRLPDGRLSLSWMGKEGVHYVVEAASVSSMNWQDVSPVIPGRGQEHQLLLVPEQSKIYRLRAYRP